MLWKAIRFLDVEDPHIFYTVDSQMAVRLALLANPALIPRNISNSLSGADICQRRRIYVLFGYCLVGCDYTV
jgi:hypothetical protein